MVMKEYDFQANIDAVNELKEADFFFKDKIEIDPEEYVVNHDVNKAIRSICDDECRKHEWFKWLNKFYAPVNRIENSYFSFDDESAYKLAKHVRYRGGFSFDFKDDKEKRLFENNFNAILSFCVGEVQLISGRKALFFESIIKALKLGAIPYDYEDGKIVVCVPKDNYVPVSKPDQRIIIDDLGQDDDFEMVNTRKNYEASFDKAAFDKAKIGDVFSMGRISRKDIEWKVLDIDTNDGSKLVITKDVIDVKTFVELNDISNRECIAWKDSKLRKWLNESFFNSIIPEDLYQNVKEITINNKKYMLPNNFNKQELNANDTLDKVFCLSIKEAEEYFNTNQDRMADATDYAMNNVKSYAYRHFKNENAGGVKWWLRDSSFGGFDANYNVVDGDGSISDYQLISYAEGVGVRPAMWIKL